MADMALTRRHHQRLRDLYRSAGWPCRDMLEVELLAAGLVARIVHPDGNETMRVTDAGLTLLAEVHQANRAARNVHEALVERVAIEMSRAGRLAWRCLSLRARVRREAEANTPAKTTAWCIACPDVFAIRNTTVEAWLEPIVHEVKVSRADLLGDLKKPAKRAAYLDVGGQCWYVLASNAAGKPIARPGEIPLECGVLQAFGDRLEVLRPAPCRPVDRLPLHVWLALARATPVSGLMGDEQGLL